jgi:hypothetical protein
MNNGYLQHWTLDEEKLAAFILQKIDQKEMSHLITHLETCSECRKRVQEERELHAGIRKYGRSEMKRKLKSRLRRDQRRRFEWINVASLAAAIVIMIGGVFATRWLIDFNQDTSKTREILLSEYKESEPGKQPLWIIGKVVEVSEKSEPPKDIAFADEINPEVKLREEISIGETAKRGKRWSEKMDTSIQTAGSEYMASIELESRDRKQENALAGAPVTSEIQKKSKALGSDKAEIQASYDSIAKVSAKPAASKEYPVTIAEAKQDQHEYASKKRPSSYITRQRTPVKNVIVRRGDMKDLPASLRSGDIAAIHTRMERTAQGILLTFYSNSIKDTVATNVEAITQDSIIVSFRKKQIVYHIPGGLSSGM